ncbi:MAG: tRNA lysidine(34) synthetase TilS [Desulfovibrio sp.]|nr:tRNA lysidine(34) synthetase TilS [Desulfovibrio sp.]
MNEINLASLPRGCAALCLRAEKVALKYGAAAGKTLLLALSGGGDSVAMTVIFHILSRRLKINLLAAHINHNLRPEADADAAFSRDLCDWLKIPFFEKSYPIRELAKEARKGLEETGREKRYEALRELRINLRADLILIAHQLDDLCEDVMTRFIRGTGWPGLAGMRVLEAGVFRPLLFVGGEELREFLRELGFSWREDSSNADLSFLRNRVRREMIPWLKKENPSFEDNIKRLHTAATFDDEFWRDYLRPYFDAAVSGMIKLTGGVVIKLPKNTLRLLPAAARLRLYRLIIKAFAKIPPSGQTRADALFALDAALREKKSGKRFQFPGNTEALLKDGGICFYKYADAKGLEEINSLLKR